MLTHWVHTKDVLTYRGNHKEMLKHLDPKSSKTLAGPKRLLKAIRFLSRYKARLRSGPKIASRIPNAFLAGGQVFPFANLKPTIFHNLRYFDQGL